MPPEPVTTRAGYVALVGRPNAGKSTLLNAFVGQKLSIVTERAQTTWQRVTGIVTTEDAQMIFLDTPGLLEVRDLLQRSMMGAALLALSEADVVLLVIDATRPLGEDEASLVRDALAGSDAPLFVALNKTDVADDEAVEAAHRWAGELGGRVFAVSALTGRNVDALREAVEAALPPGPFLYPPDDIASEPVRFFVAELVRETVIERFHQEIPWSVVCRVEEFRENQEPVYIGVVLFVERESQKGILVGAGGSAIKAVGQAAREKIEHFIGQRVYLDLWVKTLPGWRRKRGHLSRLGYSVPDDAS
ncbi:MAG: GTPase Era [Gemmatimonadetes bacterium]|nr:GTPase Era [Gemmatimonadota bacterium]